VTYLLAVYSVLTTGVSLYVLLGRKEDLEELSTANLKVQALTNELGKVKDDIAAYRATVSRLETDIKRLEGACAESRTESAQLERALARLAMAPGDETAASNAALLLRARYNARAANLPLPAGVPQSRPTAPGESTPPQRPTRLRK